MVSQMSVIVVYRQSRMRDNEMVAAVAEEMENIQMLNRQKCAG